MLFVVYMYEFVKEDIIKRKYIGSKSKCSIKDGLILNKDGSIYKGSSRDPDYRKLWEECIPILTILYYGIDSKDILQKEKEIITNLSAHANDEYFNKSIPTESNFTYSGFGTYRDIETGEYHRVSCDDYRVLIGRFVGTTSGMKSSEETKLKISERTSLAFENPNVKENLKNAMNKLLDSTEYRKSLSEGQVKRWKNISEEERQYMMDNVWSLPASDKQKETASKNSKNKITVKNIITGESRKIDKFSEEYLTYDKEIWKNPYSIRDRELVKCEYCGKEALSSSTFKRWHNDNCKYKKD